jgi:hypothetical protein
MAYLRQQLSGSCDVLEATPEQIEIRLRHRLRSIPRKQPPAEEPLARRRSLQAPAGRTLSDPAMAFVDLISRVDPRPGV